MPYMIIHPRIKLCRYKVCDQVHKVGRHWDRSDGRLHVEMSIKE